MPLQNVQDVKVFLNAALDGCCTSAGSVYKIAIQKSSDSFESHIGDFNERKANSIKN